MAGKKRKTTKNRSTRRRRVSGVGRYSDEVMIALGAIAGGVAAQMVGTSFLQGRDPRLVNGLNVVAGGFIANKFDRSPLIKGVGLGMMVNGGTAFLRSTGVLRGLGMTDDSDMMTVQLNGMADDGYVNTDIAGLQDYGFVNSMVSGNDEDSLPTVIGNIAGLGNA